MLHLGNLLFALVSNTRLVVDLISYDKQNNLLQRISNYCSKTFYSTGYDKNKSRSTSLQNDLGPGMDKARGQERYMKKSQKLFNINILILISGQLNHKE